MSPTDILNLGLVVVPVLFAVIFLIFEIYVVIIGHIKGAPYVRSSRKKIDAMITMAEIRPGEVVIDLGSGDGSLLIESAKKGARVIGIDINPFLCAYARWRIRRNGLAKRITVICGDFRNYPLKDADIVFVYLWPETLALLKNKFIQELKPGARIVSNAFRIPELHEIKKQNGVFCYIV